MSLFDRARRSIPGGVSSPARAFDVVGGDPVFADRGEGAFLVDSDGNRYIDYIQGFGSVILGHADPRVTEALRIAASRGATVGLSTEAEVRLAEILCSRFASIDLVRFVSSGTEAAMTAARIARGATGRDLIVKFDGCYHGHADEFMHDAMVLPFNDIPALESCFALDGDRVAAVFVEPIAANMGVVVPDTRFLRSIVDLCAAHGAVSVFDEVVTGSRVAQGGTQEVSGLAPDLTMLGKVIGGGLPIGAVGGRVDLMGSLVPTGPVFQAGTYAAHPHSMAAGLAVLDALTPDDFASLEATAARLEAGLTAAAKAADVDTAVVRGHTFLSVFFGDRQAFAPFHRSLRKAGVLIPPSPNEAWFPSLAHTDTDVDETIDAAGPAFEAGKSD